jgi:hypothetical protein
VTPEHKIFTKNRGYVMAKDLVETDEIIITPSLLKKEYELRERIKKVFGESN